jgi:hypothetical protein
MFYIALMSQEEQMISCYKKNTKRRQWFTVILDKCYYTLKQCFYSLTLIAKIVMLANAIGGTIVFLNCRHVSFAIV